MSTKLEICCGSLDDVINAKAGGADRVELNSALFLGGLTPSMGLVREAIKIGIPIIAMVRPREGGFCYTDAEFKCMLSDMASFVDLGVDGLVFGVLNSDGTVDYDRCAQLIKAAGDKVKVFHRAFDVVPDWKKAMEELIALGFNRILTSGQASNSIDGSETLKEMITYADGRIEILPGGGIRPHNVRKLIEISGCTQIHASASGKHKDTSCLANPNVYFGAEGMPEDEFSVTDIEKVKALKEAI